MIEIQVESNVAEFLAQLAALGPKCLEAARYAIEMHLIRNYYFVKQNYPQLLPTLVPKHAYRILKEYELEP